MDKRIYSKLPLILGIVGAFLVAFGYFQTNSSSYYLLGSFALLLTAIHYKLIYFIALECILLACHTSGLLGIGFYTQTALPILLSLQLLIFYLMLGRQNSVFLLVGIVGIALLSIGFSSENQWMYFIGSASVTVYSIYCILAGIRIAYLWAILNSIFALTAAWHLVEAVNI